jgi:hypothetical protein
MGNASNFAATLLLFGAVMGGTSSAQAQVPVEGAYERLSDGNQKIARSLYDAQVAKPATTPAPTTAKSATPKSPVQKPLTLDQIAAMKQSGQGWGQVFRSLKSQGLIQQKNLGELVSRESHMATHGVVTTAANRAYPVTRPAHAVVARGDDIPAASAATNNAGGNGNGQGHAELVGYAGHGNSASFAHGGGASK